MMERLKNIKVGDEKIGDMGVSMQKINLDKNTKIVSLYSVFKLVEDKILDFEKN